MSKTSTKKKTTRTRTTAPRGQRPSRRRRQDLAKIVQIVTRFDDLDMRLTLDTVRTIEKAPRWSKLHEREALRRDDRPGGA